MSAMKAGLVSEHVSRMLNRIAEIPAWTSPILHTEGLQKQV